MKVGILGTGSYLPEKILTNDDLSKIVDTNDEWIQTRTGIKERRIAAEKAEKEQLAAESQQLTHQHIKGYFIIIKLYTVPAIFSSKENNWFSPAFLNRLAFPRFINEYMQNTKSI